MDSPQSVVSPFKIGEPENSNSNSASVQSSGKPSNGIKPNGNDSISSGHQDPVGTLEVYVHQARDIHNICIYHKQDVYAKLSLTCDPEKSVSTKTINGGGRNPVFDDKVELDVRALDASLKCEIYMMSRVKNYLEDQLLGFTLVPMSELFFKNGKLEKEFSLSSTDLYHSPAGFVQLSLSYSGSYPEVMAFQALPSSVSVDDAKNQEGSESVTDELDKIEFPDPNVANENEKMVSEYFEMSCSTIESETSGSLVTSDAEKHVTSSVTSVMKKDSPESSNATNGAPSPHDSAHSATEAPNHDHLSLVNSKGDGAHESESEASVETSEEKTVKPVLSVRVETESKVVQQDIVDMYMKSMQQFTDSLAKMKLPLDIDNPTVSENSSSDSQKLPTPKSNKGSRVFYGSRAFF